MTYQVKKKKGGRGSECGRNWELQGQRKAEWSASESGAWLLLSCPTRDGGSWSSLKQPAAWSWQMRELLWTCFPVCKTGMRLPASWGPHTGEAMKCFMPDSASWTVLSGASPLKWLMCGSSLPAFLHNLDCQDCVLPAQSSLQIGLPRARWQVCMLVCERVCVWTPARIWAEVCTGIFDAWAWTLTSSGKEPS